jgi:hypothetical protein
MSALAGDAPRLTYFLTTYLLGDLKFKLCVWPALAIIPSRRACPGRVDKTSRSPSHRSDTLVLLHTVHNTFAYNPGYSATCAV